MVIKGDWSTDIINIADDFYEAYLRCRERKTIVNDFNDEVRGTIVNVPAIVNGTFALELYLKSYISKKHRRKLEHHISDIFFALKPNIQDQIRNIVIPKFKNTVLSFDEALKCLNNAFKRWRYIYEKPKDIKYINEFVDVLNSLPLFLNAVREIIHGSQKAD